MPNTDEIIEAIVDLLLKTERDTLRQDYRSVGDVSPLAN